MKKNKFIIEHDSLPIVYNVLSRRMFMKSLGALVAIPLLPSLLPSQALAATDADFRKAAFLIWRHGIHWSNWAPRGVNYQQIAQNIEAGPLSSGRFGDCFGSQFDSLKDKVSILEGVDMVGGHGHNWASTLTGGEAIGNSDLNTTRPKSIDVIMAESGLLYPNGTSLDVLRLSPFHESNYSHCYDDSYTIQTITQSNSAFQLVKNSLPANPPVYTGPNPPPPNPPPPQPPNPQPPNPPPPNPGLSAAERMALRQKSIVDSSLGEINKVINSSAIAKDDRHIASNYFDLLSEISRNIKTSNVSTNSAVQTQTYITGPGSCPSIQHRQESDEQDRARNMADIMLAAMVCGATRLGYMQLKSEHYYVHRVDNNNDLAAFSNFLRDETLPVAAYLMKRMDSVTEANGKTVLDNSLVMCASDLACSKFENHNGVSAPFLMGGSLGGKFRTGESIRYFNRNHKIVNKQSTLEFDVHGGRLHNELLIAIMRGFGLNQSHYRVNGQSGFGDYNCDGSDCQNNTTTQHRLGNYIRDVYLQENPNRDTALPYYYKG